MHVSERYERHAEWCLAMAEEYRRDAETVKDEQRERWLKSAERLEGDADWYFDHAEIFR